MTTASWSTVLDHSSDAAFRTWGSELSAKFAAVGMVQTADTGQINWTTVVRGASANTAAGYEIWKLSAGALYFKIEYGNGTTATTMPSLWLTVGTGSNGSGTLTGQLSTRTQCGGYGSAPASTVTNYQSYLCATASYFGLSWKIGSINANRARALLIVMQTVDSTGAATTTGYYVFLNTNSSTAWQTQCVATTAAVTGSVNTNSPIFIPNNTVNPPASSGDGAGNNQAWLWWFSILATAPEQPLLHAATALLTDLAQGNTASMTLVGTTAHTYLSATLSPMGDVEAVISSANLTQLLLWE